ncbi:hypothetical protein GVAV_000468 [Gurleya vavrai]
MGFCIVNEKPFGNFECKKLPEFKYDFRNRYSIVKREKIDFYENNKNYEKEKSDINHEKEFNNKNNEKEQLYMNQEKEFCNKNIEKEFYNINQEKESYNINYEKEQSYVNQEKEKSCLNQKKEFLNQNKEIDFFEAEKLNDNFIYSEMQDNESDLSIYSIKDDEKEEGKKITQKNLGFDNIKSRKNNEKLCIDKNESFFNTSNFSISKNETFFRAENNFSDISTYNNLVFDTTCISSIQDKNEKSEIILDQSMKNNENINKNELSQISKEFSIELFDKKSFIKNYVTPKKNFLNIKSDSSFIKALPIYSPGKILTIKPEIKLHHFLISFKDNQESSFFIFKIISNTNWLVIKSFQELNYYVKVPKLKDPISLLKRNEEIENLINKNIIKNVENDPHLCQNFLITGVLKNFELKSEFLCLKDKNKFLWVNVKVFGNALIFYYKKSFYKAINLEGRILPIEKNAFKIENKKDEILWCGSENERNEWVDFLNKIYSCNK